MSSAFGSELWNEGLKLVSYCPVCETRYNPMEARLLGQQEETQLLHVQCRKCHNSILALVQVNQIGASSVGLLTDLSFEDVVGFRSASTVSLDDVIATHTWFNSEQWQKSLGKEHEKRVLTTLRKRAKKQKKTNTAG
jgi:hypothetical protein